MLIQFLYLFFSFNLALFRMNNTNIAPPIAIMITNSDSTTPTTIIHVNQHDNQVTLGQPYQQQPLLVKMMMMLYLEKIFHGLQMR